MPGKPRSCRIERDTESGVVLSRSGLDETCFDAVPDSYPQESLQVAGYGWPRAVGRLRRVWLPVAEDSPSIAGERGRQTH